MAAASHFFLGAIAKPPLTCRESSDVLIQSASRIKRASHYDAIKHWRYRPANSARRYPFYANFFRPFQDMLQREEL